MDISYRRTPPSLLERTLARFVRRRPVAANPVAKLDLVHDVELELRHA
jgi:hypothetical protein